MKAAVLLLAVGGGGLAATRAVGGEEAAATGDVAPPKSTCLPFEEASPCENGKCRFYEMGSTKFNKD